MRCIRCDQAEREPVRRAKMVERDGRVAVVREVPMDECPACGARWLAMEVVGQLDILMRRLIESGAETATGQWTVLAGSSA